MPIGVHPIHWVKTSKGNVISAVHVVTQWVAFRGRRHPESDGVFLSAWQMSELNFKLVGTEAVLPIL
eukprot:1143100-Pelagomonas_calceolata.AAC.1